MKESARCLIEDNSPSAHQPTMSTTEPACSANKDKCPLRDWIRASEDSLAAKSFTVTELWNRSAPLTGLIHIRVGQDTLCDFRTLGVAALLLGKKNFGGAN
jgi:hypothetical protein